MTRRRDLMCEDIFGCDHVGRTSISDGGEIVSWVCACGQVRTPVPREASESGGTDPKEERFT